MTYQEIISGFPALKILVIGDIMLDHYIWGEVSRISPEAPVPVVHVLRESDTAGGAANVALNLASLGVKTELLGCVGDDAPAARLRQLLTQQGIATERCVVLKEAPTIVKTRLVARTQQLCRIDRESRRSEYNPWESPDFKGKLAEAVAGADAIIVSDYAKGVVTQELLDEVLKLGRQARKLVAVDPKPARKLNLFGVGVMTPNYSEAMELAGFTSSSHDGEQPALEELARLIDEKYAPGLLLITLGAEGMAICQQGKVESRIHTRTREVFDVSGAGDTVIAVLVAALASNASHLEAAKVANLAAGIVVSKLGTATVSPQEILSMSNNL